MQMKVNKRQISEQTLSPFYPQYLRGRLDVLSPDYPHPHFKYTQTDECNDMQNLTTKYQHERNKK